jgi:hypothetical protein
MAKKLDPSEPATFKDLWLNNSNPNRYSYSIDAPKKNDHRTKVFTKFKQIQSQYQAKK